MEFDKQQEIADFRDVRRTPQGQRLLSRILELSNPAARTFAQDPYLTAYNEGRREVGIYLAELQADVQKHYPTEGTKK